MTSDELWLYTICQKNNISITDIKISRIAEYADLLREWNTKVNLVSRKDIDRLWRTHIFISTAYAFLVKFPSGSSIVDLGTGGGMPGIPLSILFPECEFTLIDSIQKKCAAVEDMAKKLHLDNVRVINGRAEELQKNPSLKRQFTAVVARSVSALPNLVEWGMEFLMRHTGPGLTEENGKTVITRPALITLKGSATEEELVATHKTHPALIIHHRPFVFPGSEELENQDRQLVFVHR